MLFTTHNLNGEFNMKKFAATFWAIPVFTAINASPSYPPANRLDSYPSGHVRVESQMFHHHSISRIIFKVELEIPLIVELVIDKEFNTAKGWQSSSHLIIDEDGQPLSEFTLMKDECGQLYPYKGETSDDHPYRITAAMSYRKIHHILEKAYEGKTVTVDFKHL